MIFVPTTIPNVMLIQGERHEDERGHFARTFCADTFREQGVDLSVVQCDTSFNIATGTLRGMHYQAAPAEQPKLVRCTRGAIYDVALDLRPTSPTFRQWTAVTLRPDPVEALYIPPGCAHGFLTLEDATEVLYLMGATYAPAHGRGVRWDDPAFGIDWPSVPVVISERDASYPDFTA